MPPPSYLTGNPPMIMARRFSLFAQWLLLGLLALPLVSCEGGTVDNPTNEPEEATPVTTGEETRSETDAAGARLTGTVIAESDVGSLPDEPLSDQLVLLLPLDEAPRLLGASSSTDDGGFRFLHTTIEQSSPALSTLRTGPNGAVSFGGLDAGGYVLCLADATGESMNAPPYDTRGCAPLTLEKGETLDVEVSSGFGEIVLRE